MKIVGVGGGRMKILIEPKRDVEISFKEMSKELNDLSKKWDIYFIESLGTWKIIGYPKEELGK